MNEDHSAMAHLQESEESDLTRRTFLHGLGALSLASLAAPKWLFADTAAGQAAMPRTPRLGALFNPYHRPENWSLLAPTAPEGMPRLGSYSSDMVGGAATQIIWARQMGLSFVMAAYCLNRSTQGLDALFRAAEDADFSIALVIDLEGGTAPANSLSQRRRLHKAMGEIRERFLHRSPYLHDGAGRPVLAVAGLEDGRLLEEALVADPGWGTILRLPQTWRWVPSSPAEERLALDLDARDVYAGFSLRPTGRAACRLVPTHGRSARAILMSPARDPRHGIVLPPLPAAPDTGEALVILDSFNHWGISVPLEPGTASGTGYVERVRSWSSTYEG